jgi:hypothetical protein
MLSADTLGAGGGATGVRWRKFDGGVKLGFEICILSIKSGLEPCAHVRDIALD